MVLSMCRLYASTSHHSTSTTRLVFLFHSYFYSLHLCLVLPPSQPVAAATFMPLLVVVAVAVMVMVMPLLTSTRLRFSGCHSKVLEETVVTAQWKWLRTEWSW